MKSNNNINNINNKRNTVFIIIFLSILFLPPIFRNTYDILNNVQNLPSKYIPIINFFNLNYFESKKDTKLIKKLKKHEEEIENSYLSKFIRINFQTILTKIFKEGNQKVHIGIGILDHNSVNQKYSKNPLKVNNWLYHKPGLSSLTSYGNMKNEAKSVIDDPTLDEWQGPLQAIIKYKKLLSKYGVELILVPIPIKPTLEYEHLAHKYNFITKNKLSNLANSKTLYSITHKDFDSFYEELTKNGIKVIHIHNDLLKYKKKTNSSLFLPRDTHWTHNTMIKAAELVSNKIKNEKFYRDININNTYTIENNDFTNNQDFKYMQNGDLYEMIFSNQINDNLDTSEALPFPKLVTKSGDYIRSDESSPIVLLGDSFTNIYSMKSMGYGEHSGFAQYLSYYLKMPLEIIAKNGQGSTGVRKELADKIGSEEKIKTKKAIIWAIAERDLFLSETKARETKVYWKDVNFKKGKYIQKNNSAIKSNSIKILAKPIAIPKIEDPNKVTYKNALMAIDYEIIKILSPESEIKMSDYLLDIIKNEKKISVFHWAFINRKLKPASKINLKSNNLITLTISSWDSKPELEGEQSFLTDNYYEQFFAESFEIQPKSNANKNTNSKNSILISKSIASIYTLFSFILINVIIMKIHSN